MTPKIAFLLQQSIQCIQKGNLGLAETYAKKALDIDYKNFDSLNISKDDLRGSLHSVTIVKNMDLVLCVDTSLAHVAVALGKKLFILLSWTSDWRWFLDSSESPWYSSATLFRQSSPGNWPEVIERVQGALG